MSDANPLNLDHDEARALHRIVRAMHDGECPQCHDVFDAREMRRTYARMRTTPMNQEGWECPACHFSISQMEAEEVLRLFAPFMERNLAVFRAWRESCGWKYR